MAALGIFVAVALFLRLRGLSAEGFGGDEVHKWLAANRYLHGDFSGDDAEHPMLMKSLIALVLLGSRGLGWAPETITRMPNALVGGATVLAIALLGRRLFGRAVGLLAAALAAVSVTLVGYQRVAKEDTLLGLFMILTCHCLAEAKAAADDGRREDQRRFELFGACALGATLASKYFFFLAGVPVIFHFWVRRDTSWRISAKRWGALIAVAVAVFSVLDFAPFLPATWAYVPVFFAGGESVHGSLFFMGHIYNSMVERGILGTPPWFFLVFTAVKLAPVTLFLALGGLGVALAQRLPAHRLILSWLGVWFVVHSSIGGKFGRYYTSTLPLVLLLAACAALLIIERARQAGPGRSIAAWALTIVLVGGEAEAALRYAPHHRLYISPLGGGEAEVGWYFPHCDYFDAGYREAMEYIADHAEPGAEVSSELAYKVLGMPTYRLSQFFTERRGRTDLLHSLPRPDRGCISSRICYVVVEAGRLYLSNEAIVRRLAERTPWHTEKIRGVDVVKVYRLEPGEHLPNG